MAGIIESPPAHQNFSRYDIRVIIKFSVILGKDASCIHKDLVAVLEDNAPSIQTSAEWRDFDEPRPEKVRRKQGALKVMHMIFSDMNGVILRWPVPIGTTINAQYYKKVLQDKLRPAIRKKRPGLLESGILFHHDNAPVHKARGVADV
ncbi:mariner mos1 transposase [Elysia marginata]|uniref:Mariner mos1 transposase n=1 Tax=Elysia marginata TaxID=1093978 RepID=A0AAV4HFJ8_9GAST|nr:mariner mos1 transposase [Elysia marginata]